MPFPRPLCGECSNNINIIKWLEYLPLGVTYHQVIEPHIVDLVAQFSLDNFIVEKILSTDAVTACFSLIYFIIYLCVFVCACMWLFAYVRILTGLVLEGYFGHFVGKGKLVILPYRLFYWFEWE